jgi:membrane protease YdiL (CAAX protease family)
MSPLQTVYQFALGCVLALIVIKTGNVLYSIIAHATSNLTAIILSFFPLPSIPIYEPLVIVLSVLLLAFAVLLVGVLIKALDGRKENREIIKYEKEEKTIASTIYAIGFGICFIVWVLNFF